MSGLPPSWRRAALAGAVAIASGCATSAAGLDLGQKGPFETCLEETFDKWLKDAAEAVVNEDPAVKELTDESVAAWTIRTSEACRARAGGAAAASQERFENYMVRWRQHIYDLASSIRRSGQPD